MTDKSDNRDQSNRSDNANNSTATGGRFAANNGSSVTDNSDNRDQSDNSSASGARVAANNGASATDNTNNSDNRNMSDNRNQSDNRDQSAATAGTIAANNGATASMDASDRSSMTGSARNSGVFGDGALVASSTLSNYVTGNQVSYAGSTDQAGATNTSLSTSGGAYQNFSGMLAQNQNTGAAASQNATVNVAVSTRDVTTR